MSSKTAELFGRIFYGISITGIGFLHFIYKGFRGMISAVKPENPDTISLLVYLFGAYMMLSGILIVVGKKVRVTSIILACVLLLFIVFGHLPVRWHDEYFELGAWTNVLKLGAFAGGALLICYNHRNEHISNNVIVSLTGLARFGKYFFAFMLFIFGIDHFVYVDFVTSLVPKWMPFGVFWTYFTGVALLGSAISIVFNVKVALVARLLAIMLFIWVVTVHVTLAVKYPEWNNGENITASFQCFAFTGIALTIAAMAGVKE